MGLMGLLGSPTSVPLGHPDDFVTAEKPRAMPSGVSQKFTPASSAYAGYYRFVTDGVPRGIPEYMTTGQKHDFSGSWEVRDTKHVASLVPQGDWAGEDIDVSGQQIFFETGRADRLYAQVTTAPSFKVYDASGTDTQLSSWSLTGLKRFTNCMSVSGRPTWGRLELSLADSGGTRTLTLSRDGITVASGSRAGDGSITLAESNSSGLSGTVSVTYTGDVDGYLLARFPKKLKLHYRTSSFSGGDFPRTAEDTVYDDYYSNIFNYRSPVLAAGSYYLVPHQEDECGNESTGTFSGGYTVTIYAPPSPAGQPIYTSGNYSNTVVSFEASSTSGATYNVYDSAATGVLDINTVAATHTSGTGTLTQTLAAISSGFTGTRYVVIRAVKTGVEEGSYNLLKIEYSSGTVVLPRPPRPFVSAAITTSGRMITVPWTLDSADADGTPFEVYLYLFAWGSSPSYGSPTDSAQVGTARNNIIAGSFSNTAGGDGLYGIALRSGTSGGTQSSNTDTYGPFELTTAAPGDPSATVREGY